MNRPPQIAIVTPAFNEAAVLPQLFARLSGIFDQNPQVNWCAILIDDGSHDETGVIIERHCAKDSRFRLIALSRNFGFQNALAAGLAECQGMDAVITMDADLQDPPELIPELVASWQGGAEVVLAVRRSRAETGLRRIGFDIFHRCFGVLVDIKIEPNTGTFGLLGKAALEGFSRLPETHRFFPGLRAWVGFPRGEVFYDRMERAAGTPAQNLRRLVKYALDGVFSFSRLPLRVLTLTGLLIAGLGFAIGLFFIVRRLLGVEIASTGFTTMVTLLLFLGGGQLIGIGILGEYLGRIYDEVKRRPSYLVKRRIGFE